MWEHEIIEFKNYLKLERSLSDNSISAYINDINNFINFLKSKNLGGLKYSDIDSSLIRDFLENFYQSGKSTYSQARVVSGIKSFFGYLLLEEKIDINPTELIESPKLSKKLPDTLNIEDIEKMLSSINIDTFEGLRNRAIIETLYSCGLRVSELINITYQNLFLDIGFIKVLGKSSKERLVPIGKSAIKYIKLYNERFRNNIKVKSGNEGYLFLNRRGSKISRNMIFIIIKNISDKILLKKKISP